MTQPPADAPVAWPVTPEMIAAGWDCLKRPNVRSMPTLGPGMGLKEAYLAMRALEPRQAPAPRQETTEIDKRALEAASLAYGIDCDSYQLRAAIRAYIAALPAPASGGAVAWLLDYPDGNDLVMDESIAKRAAERDPTCKVTPLYPSPAPRQDEQRELTPEEASLVHGAFELSHPVQYEITPAPIHPQRSRRDE